MNKELFFSQLNRLILQDPDKDTIVCSMQTFEEYLKPACKIDPQGFKHITLESGKDILVWGTIYLPFFQGGEKVDMFFINRKALLELYDQSLKPFVASELKDELSQLSNLHTQTTEVRPPISSGLRFIPGKDSDDKENRVEDNTGKI